MEIPRNDLTAMSAKEMHTRFGRLTPGLTTEACTNEDMHTQNTYANKIGIAGERLSHSQGALLLSVTCPGLSKRKHTRTRKIEPQVQRPICQLRY